MHAVYCLSRGDIAFLAGDRQVEGEISPGVDAVVVRFRGSKSSQGRKGAVLVRAKGDGEAVKLL